MDGMEWNDRPARHPNTITTTTSVRIKLLKVWTFINIIAITKHDQGTFWILKRIDRALTRCSIQLQGLAVRD